MLVKSFVAVLLVTSCCWAARLKRQEDGEFWWLKQEKPVESEKDAEIVEGKINEPEESKHF